MKHLIFFDSRCPLCQNAVRKIREKDTQQIFTFFPLESQKAKELLSKELLSSDTLVLLDNKGVVWIRGQAVFQILHLLGGKWKWLGFLSHLPGVDLFYRLIAKNRHFFY